MNNKNFIKRHLIEEEYKKFIKTQTIAQTNTSQDIMSTQEKKITQLKKVFMDKHNIKLHQKWFINTTEVQFPEEIMWLLSLGKKFALPITHKDFPLFNVIAEGECCIKTIKDEKEQEVARGKFCNLIHSRKRLVNHSPFDRFCIQVHKETKKLLNDNPEIMVTSADKGNTTVIMYKTKYDEGMKELINDNITYRVIRKDPTTSLQSKNN